AGAVVLHVLAMGTALWIARRRGGVALVLGVAAVLALLVRAYGANTLTEAWNPYLPLLWWFVFLLALWSVLCGDLKLLPVMVGAGSFCAQTHIPYLGLTVGLGVVVVVAVVVGARAQRRAPPPRPRLAPWMLVAVAVGAVLWLPPVIDELVNSPGNMSKLGDYFAEPTEQAIGPRSGTRLLLVHLDPWQLLKAEQTELPEPVASRWPSTGSIVPGSLVLAAWVAAAVAAWRLRHATLLRLHAVVAAAMVLGVVVLSRIFGFVWYYLSLWAGGIAALLLLSLGWTVAVLLQRWLDPRAGARWATAGAVALVGVAVVATGSFSFAAADARSPDPRISRTIGELVPPTVEALEGGTGVSAGRNGRYLVTWADPVNIGAVGFGLLLELERRGFDVGVVEPNRESATAHRVLDPADATAVVHVAVGQEADQFRGKPGIRQVALVEPRSAEEQEEYARVRAEVIGDLEDAGLSDLVAGVDRNVFVTATADRVPRRIRDRMQRLIDLGLPNVVLVGSPAAFGR
ncbi:MAG: hypothetical protein H0U26_09340, partial [Acidimicrobiia bacterium]|nr:hypothetical protein [Acidimicrobiia bacterium]